MAEEHLILGRERRLALDTAESNSISNTQVRFAVELLGEADENLDRRFQRRPIRRRGRTPLYNCHGLTFGSRRTGILEDSDIYMILRDDHYNQVAPEDILPGDVILYYEDGMIAHSGVVVEIPPRGEFAIPKVVSKWGKGPEFVHYANDCPYSYANPVFYRMMK